MARYDRRDLFRHWVRKDQADDRPCTHACCRGMRAHPEGYPVARRNKWLRYSSDDDVAAYYSRHGTESPADTIARDQALAEMNRRDIRRERHEAAEERRRGRYAARQAFRRSEIDRAWLDAENGIQGGVLLNARGREAGVDERSLFTGPEKRARAYASPELLEWWEHNPRPTEAHFEGQDTRLGRYAVKSRVTGEEQAWRERFERAGLPVESVA